MSSRRDYSTWGRRRRRALDRDDHTCQECSEPVGEGGRKAEIHHKTPVSEGGGNELENLITLCHSCHTDIHSSDPVIAARKAARESPGPVFTARDVAEAAGVAKGTADRYMRELREEGVIESRKTGGALVYWFPD